MLTSSKVEHVIHGNLNQCVQAIMTGTWSRINYFFYFLYSSSYFMLRLSQEERSLELKGRKKGPFSMWDLKDVQGLVSWATSLYVYFSLCFSQSDQLSLLCTYMAEKQPFELAVLPTFHLKLSHSKIRPYLIHILWLFSPFFSKAVTPSWPRTGYSRWRRQKRLGKGIQLWENSQVWARWELRTS